MQIARDPVLPHADCSLSMPRHAVLGSLVTRKRSPRSLARAHDSRYPHLDASNSSALSMRYELGRFLCGGDRGDVAFAASLAQDTCQEASPRQAGGRTDETSCTLSVELEVVRSLASMTKVVAVLLRIINSICIDRFHETVHCKQLHSAKIEGGGGCRA